MKEQKLYRHCQSTEHNQQAICQNTESLTLINFRLVNEAKQLSFVIRRGIYNLGRKADIKTFWRCKFPTKLNANATCKQLDQPC